MNLRYLIDPIRLDTTNSHDVFFTSDTHFGHDREFLYGKRGFKNVLEHDATVIERWNNNIKPTDTVIHCGDVMFGTGGADRLIGILSALNFSKLYLLPGNHHAGYRQLLNLAGTSGIYLIENPNNGSIKEIEFVPNYMEFIVNKQPIVVCHYPIASWNGMGNGTWGVFGHCHNSYKGTQLDNLEGKCLDVGIETVNKPISFNELKTIMNTKSIKLVDHHNDSTSTALHA